MRCFLLILSFLLQQTISAQTRDILSFKQGNIQLTEQQQQMLSSLIDQQRVKDIRLTVRLNQGPKVSKFRVISELRLAQTKLYFEQLGISPQHIFTQIVIEEDAQVASDKVLVNIYFQPSPEGLIVKKTPTVQISLVEFGTKEKEPIKKIVPKGDTLKPKKNTILNAADFKKNSLITLTNLHFESGLSLIIPSSRQVLLELLDIMRSNPKLQIELQGHICCRKYGLDGYDLVSRRENLSVMRAKTVYNFMVNQGIAANRMSYKGFGSSRKLADDTMDPVAAQRNRRVEVLVVETE